MLILTAEAGDYDAIRAILGGIDPIFLSDAMLASIPYVPAAELVVIRKIQTQYINGVETWETIMAYPDTNLDKIALKAAVIVWCAYLATPAMGNLVNTAISVGEQTLDLGGVGNWQAMGDNYQEMCAQYLALITNWTSPENPHILVSGPVKAGIEPNTISGFFLRTASKYPYGLRPPGY